VVAQLVEALRYKPEARGFDFRCHWIFFNLPDPSSRTMALGSTEPLTEMSIRNLPGSKRRPGRKADNLTAICERTVYKIWEPRPLTPVWAFRACYRDSFTFYLLFQFCIGYWLPNRRNMAGDAGLLCLTNTLRRRRVTQCNEERILNNLGLICQKRKRTIWIQ
jgi:hypothetical protein